MYTHVRPERPGLGTARITTDQRNHFIHKMLGALLMLPPNPVLAAMAGGTGPSFLRQTLHHRVCLSDV